MDFSNERRSPERLPADFVSVAADEELLSPAARADLRAVADRLDRESDRLIDIQRDVHDRFAAYRRLPAEDLLIVAERNVRRLGSTLRGESGLPGGDELERAVGRARAAQQVPVDEVVAVLRDTFAGMCDAFVDASRALRIPSESTLAGVRILWRSADQAMSDIVAGYHSEELRMATHRESMRASFAMSLLHGLASENAGGPVDLGYGIRRDSVYRIVRTSGASSVSASSALQSQVRAACDSTELTALVVPIDGDVVAISAVVPRRWAGPDPLVVSAPVAPTQFQELLPRTARSLAAARAFALTGVHTLSSLAVRTAVVENGAIGENLRARLVDPVLAVRGGADFLATVEAYLANGRSIARTAEALFVHVNTVRYRLDRATALSGTDLDDLDDVVELWWALAHRRVAATSAEQSSGSTDYSSPE